MCSSKRISFSSAIEQYPAVHNLGWSDTNLANSPSFTSVQGFHQEEPHSVNNHKSEFYTCKWLDSHDLCGGTIDANKISKHMRTYHLRSPECAKSPRYCQWEGCQRSLNPYRRDTLIRHVREVHLRIPRPRSFALVTRGAIARPR